MKKLIIFGTSELAELSKFYFESSGSYKVAAFTADDAFIEDSKFLGLPTVPFSELKRNFSTDNYVIHVAVSYSKLNQLRQEKYLQVKKLGFTMPSYINEKSYIAKNVKIGENCLILENQTIQYGVEIGNNVVLWSGNHIGHGSKVGDHTYFASQVVLSGNCIIGERCFFGVNSTVVDFCEIGDDCFITMHSSVAKDLKPGSVVLSARSTILDPSDKLAGKIKKSYFKL